MKYIFAVLVCLAFIAIGPIMIIHGVVSGIVGILLGVLFGFIGGAFAAIIAFG